MQQVISNHATNKDKNKTNEIPKKVISFTLWLDKIGKMLNTSQLSNYK
jgi:hypothetical protein